VYDDDWLENYNKRWEEIEGNDQLARSNGTLVGRYLTFPYADGQAVYKIVKVNKRTVRIEVLTGIGDDWVIPEYGTATTIFRAHAEKNIRARDAINDVFKS